MGHFVRKYTDSERERIKAMWLAGETAAYIAQHFNGMTRNMAIGVVSRMNLPKRPTPPRKPIPAPKPKPIVAPVVDAPVPIGIPGDFTPNGCRWIAGEPGPGFIECGHPRKSGTSWCDHHAARAMDRSRQTKSADEVNRSKSGANAVFR